MKKALIVLLLLAIAAGGLFADINVSGSASTGFVVFIEDGGPFFTLYNNQGWNGSRWGASANLSGTHSSGKAGGSLNVGYNAAGPTAGGGVVWFKPIDSLTVNLGNNRVWWKANPPGYAGGNNQIDVGNGAFLEGNPGGGLSWGAGIYTDRDGFPAALGGFADARYGGFVKYNAGIVEVGANAIYNGGHWGDNKNNGNIDAAVGVGTNIAGIGLSVNGVAFGLQDLTGSGELVVGPKANFSFGDLSAELGAEVWIPVSGQKLGVGVGVNVGYPITSAASLTLDALFSLNNALEDRTAPYDYRAGQAFTMGYSDGTTSSLNVNPMLEVALASGATWRIGYNFMTNVGGESKMHNALYTAFRVGF